MSMDYLHKKIYYNQNLFTSIEENLTEQIKCSICLDVFDNPLQCQPCRHTYCKPCIHNIVISTTESKCPLCRASIDINSLEPLFEIKQIIENIQIHCPSKLTRSEEEDEDIKDCLLSIVHKRQRVILKDIPCTWIGNINEAEAHEAICEHTIIKCKNIGCGEVFKRMADTYHSAVCHFNAVECRHCNKKMYRYECADHEPCLEELLPCPNKCLDETGNMTTLIRHQLSSHQKVCPLESIHCPYRDTGCQEMLPRHLMEVHSINIPIHMNGLLATISSLKISNRSLRLEVKDLRKQVQLIERRDVLLCAKEDIMFPVSLDIIRNEDPGGYHRMHSETNNIGGLNFQVHIVYHPYETSFTLSLMLSDGLSRFSRDVRIVVEYRTVVLSNNGVEDFELHGLRFHVFRYDTEEFVHNLNFNDVEKAEYVTDRKLTLKTSVRLLDFCDEDVTYL